MSSWRVRLGAIVCLAFAIRLAYVVFVAPKTSGIFDAFYFQQVGHLVADGHGFISPYEFISKGRSVPSAEHPPLYTLLLAGESWLGATDDTLQRATGALLGALTVALCGLLGRRIGGDRVGLIAAGLAAVYPLLIVPDGALLSETLYLPLIAGALLAAYRLLDRPNATSAALLGALIGLAALTRAEALLLLLLLAPVAALRGGSGWPKRLTLCVVTALLVMTPWVVRNWTVFDRPLISNNEGGLIGQTNCHRAYYGSGIGFLSTNCLPPQRTSDEARRAELFRKRASTTRSSI